MEAHLAGPLTVTEVARHVAVSRDHLERLFHRDACQTWLRALKLMRLREAERLLSSTQLNLKEVAARAGFTGLDLSHFKRDFKTFNGIGPGRYRKLSRSGGPGEGAAPGKAPSR